MGVYTTKAPKACLPAAIPGQIGDEDSPLITDDHVLHAPLSIDEDSDLTPDLRGYLRHRTGNLWRDDALRADSSAIEAFYPAYLAGLETGLVPVNPNGGYPSKSKRFKHF
jgi:hypothetical protein